MENRWWQDLCEAVQMLFELSVSLQVDAKYQVKFYYGEYYVALDVLWQHNADSHSAEKATSKHIKVKQILALHTGVHSAPSQSAKALLLKLVNFSPNKRIDPIKIRVVCSTVARFSANLSSLTSTKSMNFRVFDEIH